MKGKERGFHPLAGGPCARRVNSHTPGLGPAASPTDCSGICPPSLWRTVCGFLPSSPTYGPYYVRSTVGAKRKTPAILGRSVTSGGGRLRRFERENFPRRENALHHQRPNLKALGFYSLSNRRLPHRQSNDTMKFTASPWLCLLVV